MKRRGREKKKWVVSILRVLQAHIYDSEPQRGAGTRQDQCFGHHLILMMMVAMIGGWIGRRRTIQGRKSGARDENRLVSTRIARRSSCVDRFRRFDVRMRPSALSIQHNFRAIQASQI